MPNFPLSFQDIGCSVLRATQRRTLSSYHSEEMKVINPPGENRSRSYSHMPWRCGILIFITLLSVLKWNFTTPREEFFELLKEQMNSAGLNKQLIANMFHADFR